MSALGYGLIWAGFAVFLTGTIRHGMRLTLADVTGNARPGTCCGHQ